MFQLKDDFSQFDTPEQNEAVKIVGKRGRGRPKGSRKGKSVMNSQIAKTVGNDACSPRGENEENFPGILVEQPRSKFRSKLNATGELRPTKYLLTTFD